MKYPVHTGVSYFSSRDLRHVRDDLEDIKRHHCDFVVLTYSEEDLRYYRQRMIEIVALAHDLGLSVHLDPWGVGKVFGGEASTLLVAEYPEVHQLDANDQPLPAACPNHPRFLAYLEEWLLAAAEARGDYCFWDEPHFYVTDEAPARRRWGCFCAVCRERFAARYGRSMPRGESKEVIAFREESLVHLVETVTARARQLGMANNLCLLPFDDGIVGVTRWERFAANPHLAIIGTDPYWGRDPSLLLQRVPPFAQKVAQVARQAGKEAQFWVQNIFIAQGDEATVEQALQVAWDAGIRNFAAWSYYGTAPMSALSCADPLAVWDRLGQAYRRFRASPA